MATKSPRPSHLLAEREERSGESLHERWGALHEKSGHIAQIADLAPEAMDQAVARFEQALVSPNTHTLRLAKRGLEDMELLVEMGLTALREVEARGQPANAPALALWREFYHAREAVLAILEPAAA